MIADRSSLSATHTCATSGGAGRPADTAPARSAGRATSRRYAGGLFHKIAPSAIAERSAGNLLPAPWIEAEDVVHAVRYLASGQARYMTSAQFVLDAGLLTR